MHAASCPADLLRYVWERSLWSRPARRRRLSCRRIERVLKSIIADSRRPILRSPETGMVMKELFGKRRARLRLHTMTSSYLAEIVGFGIGILSSFSPSRCNSIASFISSAVSSSVSPAETTPGRSGSMRSNYPRPSQ